MKQSSKILSMLMIIAGMTVYVGCSKDDDPAKPFNLVSLMAGTKDLNGASFATDVPVDQNIVAVFSTDVDAATVTASTVTLKRGSQAIETTITVDGSTVTINPNVDLFTGTKYDLSISGDVKSKKGVALTTASTSFTTEGIGLGTVPQSSSEVMYLPLNGSIEDITGNAAKVSEKVAYMDDRFGVANGAAYFRGATEPGNGDLVELSGNKFINASTTFSVWMKVALADYPTEKNKAMFGLEANHGFFMEVGDNLNWIKFATNHLIPAPTDGSAAHCFGTAWTDPNSEIPSYIADKWAHLVMTYDAATSLKTIYLNGVQVRQNDLGHNDTQEWNMTDFVLGTKDDGCNTFTAKDTKLALGFFYGQAEDQWGAFSAATNTYKGGMDDFRIWSKALTASEVTDLYNSEKP